MYEKFRSITRNGTRAGTTPWQKSIKKCPSDSTAIACLFINVLLGLCKLVTAPGRHRTSIMYNARPFFKRLASEPCSCRTI